MRALYIHISGLVSLLVFLKEVLNYAPLERTILVSATTGLTVYLMLIVGHTIVRRIVAYSPPASPSGANAQPNTSGDGSSEAVEKATAAVAASNRDASAATPDAPNAPNASPSSDSPDEAAPQAAPQAAPEAGADTNSAAQSAPDRAPQDEQAEPAPSNSVAQTTA